ncbi:response regulator [Dechloromonas sp. A34]|uniref:response regulator n=1 Tax=Dechloromonas sp. A34 TaxID=447588 RepID=UPI00224974D2|nr:response regulator transcription factor [Dechloromonas sp. A34]
MSRPDPNAPLTIVLIEDSLLLRETVGAVLGELAGVRVVGAAADETTAIELLQSQQPDLAIVDLELRAGSGLGVLRMLYGNPDRFGRPRAVVFSNHNQSQLRERCIALGAERFFDKSTQMDELLAYVRLALAH